jgi:hypothetical protein
MRSGHRLSRRTLCVLFCGLAVVALPVSAALGAIVPTHTPLALATTGGGASCSGDHVSCGVDGIGPVAIGGGAACTGTGNSSVSCGNQGVGPLAVGGNASCSGDTVACGNEGVAPVAVGGNANCTQIGPQEGNAGSCGTIGAGPIAVGGNASCNTQSAGNTVTCGSFGLGPVAVDGNATCSDVTYSETQCGNYGIGPIAVGGSASCLSSSSASPYSTTCGATGTGPLATGNVTCSRGSCESLGSIATPGISILGHAYCSDPARLTDPAGVASATCLSVEDFLGLG